ncbi:hypothetical protein [Peptoniphilus sp. Marseille-Q6390]
MKLPFVNKFSFTRFLMVFYVLVALYDFINFCKLISIHDFIIFYKPIRVHDFTSFYDLMTPHKLINSTKKSALRQINISYLQLNYHIESLPALDI